MYEDVAMRSVLFVFPWILGYRNVCVIRVMCSHDVLDGGSPSHVLEALTTCTAPALMPLQNVEGQGQRRYAAKDSVLDGESRDI